MTKYKTHNVYCKSYPVANMPIRQIIIVKAELSYKPIAKSDPALTLDYSLLLAVYYALAFYYPGLFVQINL